MAEYISVDYASVVPMPAVMPAEVTGEFIDHAPLKDDWGQLNVNSLRIHEIQILKFDAQVKRNLHLKKREEQDSTTVNTCIFLEGAIDSVFAGQQMSMEKGMQNFIYHPGAVTDHYIREQAALKLLHISIDRHFFAQLLSDQEKWSAELKANILNNKLVCGPATNQQMSSSMIRIVNEILNCPLTGNLRAILLEAKITEFVALQLNQLIKENSTRPAQQLKSADKDTLYALREYLHKTFTHEHSLRSLAMQFGINEFKLKKGFRELFGTTVFEHLHDLKMDFAKQLLEDGEIYVSEISGKVGYKNPNHFSTAFKKKFGINPSLIRK